MDSYRLSDDEVHDLYRDLADRAEQSSDPTYHIQLASEVKPYVRLDRLEVYLEVSQVSREDQLKILDTYLGIETHSIYLEKWRSRLSVNQ